MNTTEQHLPTLNMWQRILSIRQRMQSARGEICAPEEALTDAAAGLQEMQEDFCGVLLLK